MRPLRPIRARHVVLAWAVIYFPWLPGWPLGLWLPGVPEAFVIDANVAAQYALVAISLVILTGWVGQISLGQGSFVGIGAFTTGLLFRVWHVPFPYSLPIVALTTAAVAACLGVVALRVRGLYLAVATLIFAWMADAYLFSASWFVGEGGSSSVDNPIVGQPGTVTAFDLTKPRVLYLVMLAAVAGAWYAAVNLRDSKTGRAFFAIRGSEMAAVSLGIDVTRYKLLAFALSGGLAGIAGNLVMTDLRAATPVIFQFTQSLFYLGIAVVGGISSLGGALAAAILFSALNEVFFRVDFLTGWFEIVTVGLLLAVLLGYPGGLSALGLATRTRLQPVRLAILRRWEAFREGLFGHHDEPPRPSLDIDRAARAELTVGDLDALGPGPVDWRTANVSFVLPPERADRNPVLEAEGIVVRFGGLTAVDDFSLVVREHEIVGLIGPNGAGKTTTFNAIAGLNEPASGTVRIFGQDATRLPVHVRAQMGVGRTFQLIQLFPELTVFDNLLAATHVHNSTGVLSHLAVSSRAIEAEATARRRVRQVASLLGLEEFVDRRVAGLPFGVLRQVEIARALVTEAPLLMLDEPASGLDNAETDELARLLRYVRGELGVSILLIEHDVRMVTSVSDYIYVLDRGRPLADGTPGEIQRNPAVVAAYLGQADADAAVDGGALEAQRS
jgi:ABC-type branched-subunit amino acid transport system ATPase component/ABC-type branched-subunit amino acid transport system permease subunit